MNTQNEKISLWAATLITINVMFGSGLIINTVNLSKKAGFFSFLGYVFVALILSPLMVSIATLVKVYPKGGFYAYAAKNLSPFWGFVSAWTYFVGKLASAALLVHVFSLSLQHIIPHLSSIDTLFLDAIIISLFMWLNNYGIQMGIRITYTFLFMKLVPVVFGILSSIYLFRSWEIPAEAFQFNEIFSTIPLVLFAFVGFEAACSISLKIKDPEKNGPKAIFFSFIFTESISVLYQLMVFLALGDKLGTLRSYFDIFPLFLTQLFNHHSIVVSHLLPFLYIAVATAALGGSYGIIFSNSWNLYTLAENGYTFFPKTITKKNKYGAPFASFLIAGIITIAYLVITNGQQLILQQISVAGVSVAFTLSTISLLVLVQKTSKQIIDPIIPWLALGSCLVFTSSIIYTFYNTSEWRFLSYLIIFITLGIGMFLKRRKTHHMHEHFLTNFENH